MLYEEARVYLDSVSKYGSVLGLDSIKNLLEELGNPQKELTFIHIAGTNGKGSILAYLSTILTEAGYRTGRYISPTVMEYLERFQIDGAFMEKEELAQLTCQVKEAAERLVEAGKPSPTVFEIETAMAFLYFKESGCDFVVLESGLDVYKRQGGESVKAAEKKWNPNVKSSNVEAIESATGRKIELVANEQSLPMSQKRKEKYD